MRILALIENLPKALETWRGLQSLPDIELRLLVCANSIPGKTTILWSFSLDFLHLPLKNKLLAVQLLLRRRLVLSLSRVSDQKVLKWIKSKRFDIGLHNMSIIYRDNLISLFRLGIINAHIGLLPDFRGRCVMEWSILAGKPTGITAFFIDTGIDTGRRLILFKEVDISRFKDIDTAKQFMFSRDIGIFKEAVTRAAKNQYLGENDISKGKRYYVMSSLLKGVVHDIMNYNPGA
jgi:folate-dependent phosphoribosylglycinamide formyltransferase PurN